ncbi:MAG: hypothetical protein H7Z14_02970 [Anaerolineae bacterium]|nr:hypothetical protein [Phycisphaerae bacterium]
MPKLEYEPQSTARPVSVERDGDVTRIIVAMPRLYAPVPTWVADLDLLSIVIWPIWMALSVLYRTLSGISAPPRALFEVRASHLTMSLCDPSTGKTTTTQWPLFAIVEMRPNRYGAGMWVNVTGGVKDTVLEDIPRETVERLASELGAAMPQRPST